eukprot:CAMPEP_0178532288 /NCGR_PEP_ID=MMETSP0696-20121128/33891_1 /TAXON_ID=265572 /ORGANISM="Extubocellulus spinifer, Strain CCMP396" /LENGTH=155 /DNA_ID=CAMNT_0020164269 /DNA_START=33 /DNA_END=500 /DNA_ORIENTATION=-
MTDVNSAAAATTPITPLPATSAIVPPPAVQHPLHLLDQFLQHLDSSENDASNSHETVDGTSTSNDNATNQGEDAHKARLHRQAARDESGIPAPLGLCWTTRWKSWMVDTARLGATGPNSRGGLFTSFVAQPTDVAVATAAGAAHPAPDLVIIYAS